MADTVEQPRLTLAGALKILNAAQRSAEDHGVRAAISVTDDAGRPLVFLRHHDAAIVHAEQAPKAAARAAATRSSSVVQQTREGAVPMYKGGVLIGAVGVVSGDPAVDIAIARTGLAALAGASEG